MTRKAFPRRYDEHGAWVKLDARHVIRIEGTGAPTPQWVFRWCGDEFVGAWPTRAAAVDAALSWEVARVARMLGEVGRGPYYRLSIRHLAGWDVSGGGERSRGSSSVRFPLLPGQRI